MQPTNAQRAYDHLRLRLINGEFVPGTRIRYGPVGKELGISATPVREAIGQLATEGFVQLVPQLGAVVKSVSREELIELYAAARAAERIEERQLNEIRQHVDRMNALAAQARTLSPRTIGRRTVKQFEQADLAFHMLIIEATGNQTMVRTVGNSHVLARIFSAERHGYDADVLKATCEDHQRILTALERRRPDAARDAMAVHIRNGLEITLAADAGPTERWWEKT